jgi:hypothetical protein
MKLVAQLKLCPTKAQARILKDTLERANAACDHISEVAWEQRTFGKYALQKLCYRDVRSGFELSAMYGVPDVSVVSMTQHLDMTRAMVDRHLARLDQATLISGGNDGFFDVYVVASSVAELEAAASAVAPASTPAARPVRRPREPPAVSTPPATP